MLGTAQINAAFQAVKEYREGEHYRTCAGNSHIEHPEWVGKKTFEVVIRDRRSVPGALLSVVTVDHDCRISGVRVVTNGVSLTVKPRDD